MVLFVVSSFADVNLLVGRKVAGTAFVVTCNEHDETPVHYLVDAMVSILASLDNLIFEEVPVETVHGLLWTPL